VIDPVRREQAWFVGSRSQALSDDNILPIG
jgi:hypothetical protein